MGTLANSEYPDEIEHNTAFHHGLHCLLRLKQPSGTDIHNKIGPVTQKKIQCKIAIIFLSISLNIWSWFSKEPSH